MQTYSSARTSFKLYVRNWDWTGKSKLEYCTIFNEDRYSELEIKQRQYEIQITYVKRKEN